MHLIVCQCFEVVLWFPVSLDPVICRAHFSNKGFPQEGVLPVEMPSLKGAFSEQILKMFCESLEAIFVTVAKGQHQYGASNLVSPNTSLRPLKTVSGAAFGYSICRVMP